jgi:TorA maturation chaperone TorD
VQQFSKQLIDDFIAYWHTRLNEKISEDQAEQYLNSLAELFLLFSKNKD